MAYRPLGRTGVSVSNLCLGAMMFGPWGNSDRQSGINVLHRALDAGINFIETADVYSAGESEEIVGQALTGRRDDVVLATKFHNPMGEDVNARGNSRRWITRAVEDSLRRLGTDWIDLYQVHRPSPDTNIEETLGALDDLVHAGKIRYIGSSTFPGSQIVKAQWAARDRCLQRFVTEQPPYSILVRGTEADVLPTTARHGMGALTYSPLAGGWLSGGWRTDAATPTPSPARQRLADRFDLSLPVNQRKLEAAEALAGLAEEAGLTLIEMAIAFVLNHPSVTSAIIGPRTLEQLESQMPAADVVLEKWVLDRIDDIVPPGVTINPADSSFLNPALQPAARRRGARRTAARRSSRETGVDPPTSGIGGHLPMPSSRSAAADAPGARRAVVVGASLAGLMSALALARTGWQVTVLERAGEHRSSGAALAVDPPDFVELLGDEAATTVLTHLGQDAANVGAGLPVTWQALHAGLRHAADQQSTVRLQHRTTVVEVGQDATHAWALTDIGETYTGDLLVGADGYRSLVRVAVAPDKPDARYAGYVLWLGIAAEQDLGPLRWPTGLDIRDSGDHILLGYPLPAADGSRVAATRQLGWAWYDATRDELFRRTGAVHGSVVQHSLRPGDIPEATYADLSAEATRRWPAPWAQAIADSIARRAVTATPISEYLPDLLADGRMVLVGDAAHVPTPMTGGGFAASLADARTLALALAESAGDGVPDALLVHQEERLGPARWLVQSGQGFSRSFAGR